MSASADRDRSAANSEPGLVACTLACWSATFAWLEATTVFVWAARFLVWASAAVADATAAIASVRALRACRAELLGQDGDFLGRRQLAEQDRQLLRRLALGDGVDDLLLGGQRQLLVGRLLRRRPPLVGRRRLLGGVVRVVVGPPAGRRPPGVRSVAGVAGGAPSSVRRPRSPRLAISSALTWPGGGGLRPRQGRSGRPAADGRRRPRPVRSRGRPCPRRRRPRPGRRSTAAAARAPAAVPLGRLGIGRLGSHRGVHGRGRDQSGVDGPPWP